MAEWLRNLPVAREAPVRTAALPIVFLFFLIFVQRVGKHHMICFLSSVDILLYKMHARVIISYPRYTGILQTNLSALIRQIIEWIKMHLYFRMTLSKARYEKYGNASQKSNRMMGRTPSVAKWCISNYKFHHDSGTCIPKSNNCNAEKCISYNHSQSLFRNLNFERKKYLPPTRSIF